MLPYSLSNKLSCERCGLGLPAPDVAQAQYMGRRAVSIPAPEIGARASLNWDEEVWGVGGHLKFMLPFLPGISIQPSGDLFFTDERNEWQVNIDAVLQLASIVYGGAGFAVARDSLPTAAAPSTETGYNLFLGLQIPRYAFPVKPFVEARWTYINRRVRPFRVMAGLSVRLGGPR